MKELPASEPDELDTNGPLTQSIRTCTSASAKNIMSMKFVSPAFELSTWTVGVAVTALGGDVKFPASGHHVDPLTLIGAQNCVLMGLLLASSHVIPTSAVPVCAALRAPLTI